MSVTDVLSPMSVDKSMLNQSISNMSFVRSNEADRYFEMHDYQIDVLEYLREAEVNKINRSYSCVCNALHN